MVGAWDMILARSIACRAVSVRTDAGMGYLGEYRHTWADTELDFVAADVFDVARWIASGRPGCAGGRAE